MADAPEKIWVIGPLKESHLIESRYVCTQIPEPAPPCPLIKFVRQDIADERVREARPLCPVHQHLSDSQRLQCELQNNCVACSLNERTALLEILATGNFDFECSNRDSVSVLQEVIDFWNTHQGTNRVVVSYPARAAEGKG